MIKLIASDMDNTLLNSNIEISGRNAVAVRKAVAAGLVFVLATGRMYVSARPHALRMGLDTPIIAYNGALVRSLSGQILYEHKVKLSTAQAVLDYCRANKLYTQVYVDDQLLIERENDYSRMYTGITKVSATAIGSALYTAAKEPYKILLIMPREKFAAAWEEIAARFAGQLDVTSSMETFLELMEPGVNKWEAVKATAAGYGIQPSEIMCIGDSSNDLPMITNAATGVAVANAAANVRERADIVTASNDDDGVALVLEELLARQGSVR